MNCREFHEFIISYKRDELSAEVSARFRAHMELCPPCVNYLEQYDATIVLGKGCYDHDDPPRDMPEELVRAILDSLKTDS